MVERVDRRVLGAIRLVDGVTGTAILRPIHVEGPGLTIRQNRTGLHVLMGAEGLEAHVTEFAAPPAAPAAESLDFTVLVHDPRHAFLPTLADIALPRPWDPGADVRAVMEPIEIALPSSPARSAPLTWALLAARVEDTAGNPLPGALVELRPPGGGARRGWGVTGRRGETVVPVPDLPAMREVENDPDDEEDNEIVTAETALEATATVDPGLPWPADPARLAAGGGMLRSAAAQAVSLSPGRTDTLTLVIDLT